MADSVNQLTDGAGKVAKGFEGLAAGTRKVRDAIKDTHSTFEALSGTGNRFNNDMVELAIAAANARMPLKDFANLLKDNSENFAALGGNVSKGGQVFTDFSKAFHTSGVAENLRQIGFTTGELNEILALSVGFQKSSFDKSAEGQRKAATGAAEFAYELDRLTQLTGQSRREQEDNLKRAQADMKLEAKFREIGFAKGPEEEAKARAMFKENFAVFAAKGMGDMYKEMVAMNTVTSQAAQTQFAISGKAGQAAMQSAIELGRGNTELAKAATERAEIEVMNLQRSRAFNRIAMYASGTVGEVARQTMAANDKAYHGMLSTMKEYGIDVNNVNEALKKQAEEIKKEQNARSGITSALITSKMQLEAAYAGFMERIVGGVNKNKELNDSLLTFSKQFSQTQPGDLPKDTMKRFEQALKEQKPGGTPANAASTQEMYARLFGQAGGDFAVQLGSKISSGLVDMTRSMVSGGLGAIDNIINAVDINLSGDIKTNKEPKTGRAGGTLGETGNVVEPKDVHALLHKGEMVLTPEQQRNMMTNVRTDAIADIMHKMVNTSSKTGPADTFAVKDLQKIAKDITSVASKVEVINWPKNFMGVAANPPAQTKPSETKPTEVKPSDKKEEKKSDPRQELAKQMPTQASVRSVDNQIDRAEEIRNAMPSIASLFIKDQEDELETAAEQFSGVFKDLIPIQELETTQEEFRSKFNENQKRLIEDYKNSSEENRFFAAEEQRAAMEQDLKLLQTKNAEIERLTEERNKRELTEEEEFQLAEETMNRDALRKLVEDRQDHIDVIENIDQYAYERDLEKQVENAKVFADQKAKAQSEELESLGGITDAALQARQEFLNQLDSSFTEDEYGEGGDAIGGEMDRAFVEDEDSYVAEALKAFNEQVPKLTTTFNEFSENAEEVDSTSEFNDYNNPETAITDLTEQIQGLKEFEQDEYGDGGEAIGGEMDSAFAEDEDSYVAEALKGFQNLIPDSMIDDAAYAAGPGDASIAGFDHVAGKLKKFQDLVPTTIEFSDDMRAGEDIQPIATGTDSMAEDAAYAAGPGDASIAGFDHVAEALKGFQNLIPDSMIDDAAYAAGPGNASVAGIDYAEEKDQRLNVSGLDKKGKPQTESNFSPITMDMFTLGPDGLPIAKPKAEAKTIPAAVKKDENQSDAETKRLQRQNDAKKAEDDKKSEPKPAITEAKPQSKTLDDVVKILESLNTSIGKLTQKVEETSNKEISAMKSMDGNLFKR